MQMWSRRTLIAGMVAGFASMATPLKARVSAPRQAYRLRRRLMHQLNDGERIVVEREWLIHFEQQGSGLAITGHQTDVRVEAPPRIAAIADIERQRSTDGKFPILLDGNGAIIAAGEAELQADVAKAVEVAEKLIAQSGIPLADQRRSMAYLSQLQGAAGSLLDRLPRDLFFPRNSGFATVQPVKLPDGNSGEFEVDYKAIAQPDSGLLDRAERRIVTRIGASERHSSEVWSLSAS